MLIAGVNVRVVRERNSVRARGHSIEDAGHLAGVTCLVEDLISDDDVAHSLPA
jgi:hypothetical protein